MINPAMIITVMLTNFGSIRTARAMAAVIASPSFNSTITETINLLKGLWDKQSDEDKLKIGEVANKLREIQKAFQIEVTK